MTLLRVTDVRKRYYEREVLQGVSFELKPGEIITLVGPNGAGKTTLLELMLGLQQPDSGTVERRDGLRIGYVPQRFTLNPALPMSIGAFLSLYSDTALSEASLLAELHLADRLDASMHTLSGGERQRVLFARALLAAPDVLVLDEPMQSVDVQGQIELFALIERLAKERNIAVFLVSHDLHLVMAATHEVLCLHRHICCRGRPHQLNADPAFAELFGKEAAAHLAVYSHAHDHVHHADGEVCDDPSHQHGGGTHG